MAEAGLSKPYCLTGKEPGEPSIAHHFGGGVYAKETMIPRGMHLEQHAHAHDHLSVLASGSVRLTVDGVVREVVGPVCLNISAGKRHGVEALTDVVWYCIHATDCEDETEVDGVLIA